MAYNQYRYPQRPLRSDGAETTSEVLRPVQPSIQSLTDWNDGKAVAETIAPIRKANVKAGAKSSYKVILMGGADFYNQGDMGSNKALGEYVAAIATSAKYNIPLSPGDIRLVNSPIFANSTSGKDLFDELLIVIKDGFDTSNGALILYGYSWGGQLLLEFQEFFDKAGAKINLLITVDAARGPGSWSVSREVTDNVLHNLNIYQTSPSLILSRGAPNTGAHVTNVDLTGQKNSGGESIVHANIDEYSLLYCAQVIVYALSGIYSYENYSEAEIRKQIQIYSSQGY
jgi:hypothetical protein